MDGDGACDTDSASETDPLDAEHFNSVDYINRQFPNEGSLANLDSVVEKLKAQQKRIDEDIRQAVRRQATCGRRARSDLDEAKSAVHELFERIKAIQAKAEQSETLVSDVCRDIKSLDIAKRNLTLSITALKRLVMLVTALEQLRTMTLSRRYREAAGLLRAIEELAGHFQELSHVARVADLLERKNAILSELKTQILEDFASLHGAERQAGVEEAAHAVDAMGTSVQREVITQFCLRLLEDYKDDFQPPKEASGLETAERRYVWLKKTLVEYEQKYAAHFPDHWRVPCGLCEHFCHVTRQHLVEVLSVTVHSVDPELMVRVLRKSIEFENELARKYPVEQAVAEPPPPPEDTSVDLKYRDMLRPKTSASGGGDSSGKGGQKDEQFAPRFRGIISMCFGAYLGSWVQHEEKQLMEALDRSCAQGADKIVEQDDEQQGDGGTEPRSIYYSATGLFVSMKGSVTKCAAFSTHQTLFDIFQSLCKVIAHYVDRLSGQFPAKVSAPLDNSAVQAVCCVIGTAEYCDEMLPQLAAELLRIIDSSFEGRVAFDNEQDLLRTLMGKANQVLVQSVNASLDDAFLKMTRTAWAQFSQDVGDTSPYVGDISERLSVSFEPIAKHLSKIHYRSFCGKFVQAFVARFIAEIYKCKKISEQGAQQLLLDTSFIKQTLLEAPVTASGGKPMQTAYSNYVLREMGKAETMLKILSSPDVDAGAVSAMLGDDRMTAESNLDIERLLALRASADGEVPVFVSLRDEERLDSSGVGALRSTMMSLGDSLKGGAKTAEDLKRDMKKKFLSVNLPGIGRKANP
eukprot:TRINITY_DN74395_c0_g1_i1.p1 TRINITY_DN74395_c0_g1~~TRINITY_DN74395_c0_g1_i1.p1  ORF type:complete len:824 (+),score=128.80 TRINITY_DN74395_c0_g1_i1:61-2472(+)